MRSAVFVLIFAVCLVALNCETAAEGEESAENTGQEKLADPVVTTKAPEQISARETEIKARDTDKTHEAVSPVTLKKPPVQSPHEKTPSEGEEQKETPQLSQSDTNQISVQPQGETNEPTRNGHDAKDNGPTQDTILKAPSGTVEKKTGGSTGDQEPNGHGQSSSLQLPSSSTHSPETGVKQPQKKTLTPTITDIDHKPTEGTESVPLRTEENPKKENGEQVKSHTAADDKTDIQEITKIPIATADNTPLPAQKTETLTPASADDTEHQTPTITKDKKQNTMHTQVTSTLQPVKVESILPANTSEELSKAMQTLDNKDSSIVSSLVCALAALATLVLVAVSASS